MKNYIYFFTLLFSSIVFSQVGIGTNTPSETLEVNGTTKLHQNNKIYLENPGYYSGTSGSSSLMVKDLNTNELKKFDPATANFSSVYFTSYFFDNVAAEGLSSYNTKIDASKYYVSVGGFIVLKNDGTTSISIEGTTSTSGTNNYFPLYSARAFVQNGTWHLKFLPNNNRVFESQVDIYLNVSIYRKNLLTNAENAPIVVNLQNGTTGTAPAPNL